MRPTVTTRELITLTILVALGALLLACGVWVTGAGAMFEPLATDDQTPSDEVPTSTTTPAIVATDVEGGPDEVTGS